MNVDWPSLLPLRQKVLLSQVADSRSVQAALRVNYQYLRGQRVRIAVSESDGSDNSTGITRDGIQVCIILTNSTFRERKRDSCLKLEGSLGQSSLPSSFRRIM